MANYIKGTKIQENSISETKLDSSLQSWKETVTNHINNNDNPHNITKSSIGLDNVTNDAQVKRSELGVANGVATLDSTGKVPSGQLPSYVDDVIEGYLYNGVFYKDTSYTTSIVGESGKIYIDLPTNKTYRWTGSVYGVISETIALGETSSTAYRGDRGKIAYDHSQSAHAPSNAQANVIETIKVNGTALTPNSKAVDITVPTVGNGTITIKQGGTSKGTFTTNQNGNTTIELTDTNTTYTAGDGLSLSGTTFSNNGVRSIAIGTTNGTISVNTNGNISNIGVYGLKSAAYTDSSAYATASHTHSYLPLSGGTMSNTNVVTNLNADLLDGYHASNVFRAPSFRVDNPHTSNTYVLIATITISGTSLSCAEFTALFQNREVLDSSSFILSCAIRRNSTSNVNATLSYITLHTSTPRNIYLRSDDGVTFRVYIQSVTNTYTTFYRAVPLLDTGNITYSNTGTTSPISGSVVNITATKGGNVASASKWANPRTITLTGSVTGSVSIDGSGDVSLATTTNHTHTFDSLTSKPTTISGYGITDAYTASTIDSKLSGYLPLSGGTMNGIITMPINYQIQWGDDSKMIYGSDNAIKLFSPRGLYINDNLVIHSGNYNSYSPKLDGTGATGTWGISISGNAATATKLANSRTIWGRSFDGTENVSGPPSFPSIIDINRNAITGAFIDSSKISFEIETFANDVRLKTYSASGGSNPYHLVLTSNGNVGIGTTSPSYKLHVAGSTYLLANKGASEQPTLGNVGAGSHTLIGTDSYGLEMWSRTNGNFGMQVHRFDGTATAYNLLLQPLGGNVGIGTSSPAYNLDIDGNMRITGPIRLNVPNSNENYYISTEYNGLLGITYEGRYQNPAFLMNNLGYVYLNCENPLSPAYPLVVNGTIECTKLLQTSDIKYKTNIKQIEYEEALKIIENLNPVTWDWNENTVETGSSSGFIAQEAEEFIPNAISRDNENNLSLDYTQLHSYEIRVIQEQQKEIKDLKQRLEVLESLVLQLTNREI